VTTRLLGNKPKALLVQQLLCRGSPKLAQSYGHGLVGFWPTGWWLPWCWSFLNSYSVTPNPVTSHWLRRRSSTRSWIRGRVKERPEQNKFPLSILLQNRRPRRGSSPGPTSDQQGSGYPGSQASRIIQAPHSQWPTGQKALSIRVVDRMSHRVVCLENMRAREDGPKWNTP
jgi:hypothetical protein